MGQLTTWAHVTAAGPRPNGHGQLGAEAEGGQQPMHERSTLQQRVGDGQGAGQSEASRNGRR